MRLVLAFLAAIGFAGGAAADGIAPVVPAATGEPHPVDENWRANHMVFMKHDRDLTMREGEREEIKASLSQCFDCHTVKDEAGTPVTYEDERHFCRVCHDFAAVQVDCFSCHRSLPDDDKLHRAMAKPTDHNSIEAYLKRVSGEAAQ